MMNISAKLGAPLGGTLAPLSLAPLRKGACTPAFGTFGTFAKMAPAPGANLGGARDHQGPLGLLAVITSVYHENAEKEN